MKNRSHLTVKTAREVLGKLAEGISDEELEKEVQAAQLLKSLFFNTHKNSTFRYNKNNGKA